MSLSLETRIRKIYQAKAVIERTIEAIEDGEYSKDYVKIKLDYILACLEDVTD